MPKKLSCLQGEAERAAVAKQEWKKGLRYILAEAWEIVIEQDVINEEFMKHRREKKQMRKRHRLLPFLFPPPCNRR